MDRRKKPRKEWVVSKDDVGRSVLEWKVDPMRAKRMESDPCERTYDFLNRLNHPDLALEDEGPGGSSPRDFHPYGDEAPPKARKRSS